MPCDTAPKLPPLAAYLYLLHADSTSLAWEYLRRNPAYQQAAANEVAAADWGLESFVDPLRDAVSASPSWLAERQLGLQLQPDLDAEPGTPGFDLWALAGRKQVEHDGCKLRISCFTGFRVLRLAIAKGLGHGMAYCYALKMGLCLCDAWRSWLDQLMRFDRQEPLGAATHPRPSRTTMTHLRTLIALDAQAAGASHRDIAVLLFGSDEADQRWHADSELRAQVRHLLKRGHAYVNGNYRKLLTATS